MKRLPDIITLGIITANGLGVSWSALYNSKWIGGFLVGVVVLVGSSRPFCFLA